MSRKSSEGLVIFVKGMRGTPYAYGVKGVVLTQKLLDKLAEEYPKIYTRHYKEMTAANLNKVCVDCSGLISCYTGIVRGSSDYCDSAVERKPISCLDETMIGWALWKEGHIGVYLGGGKCMEARGVSKGVIETNVRDVAWEKVLKLCDIDYASPVHPPKPIVKDGWVREEDGWRYYTDPETYVRNDWLHTDGNWYWFDGSGFALSEKWYQYHENWYYFRADCSMATGLTRIKGRLFYFYESGRMAGEGELVLFTPDEDGDLKPVSKRAGALFQLLWPLVRGR